MKKVAIFMSTYNGEKYIAEQIDSIMSQVGVEVVLVVRDDKSTDGTPLLLNRLKEKYAPRLVVELGKENLFPHGAEALYKLIDLNQFDYYAFSDHDDVWESDKLAIAVEKLEELDQEKACLYYSNLAVTDENLNYKFDVYGKNRIKSTCYSCFVDFAASANTFVFNRKALDLFRDGNQKDFFYGDVWQQTLCFFVGQVIYDDTPHILFRRTGSNVSGERPRGLKLWLKRLKSIKEERHNCPHIHKEMAKTILENYDSMLTLEKKDILKQISTYDLSFKNRVHLFFSKKIKSKSFSKNLCFRGRILLKML